MKNSSFVFMLLLSACQYEDHSVGIAQYPSEPAPQAFAEFEIVFNVTRLLPTAIITRIDTENCTFEHITHGVTVVKSTNLEGQNLQRYRLHSPQIGEYYALFVNYSAEEEKKCDVKTSCLSNTSEYKTMSASTNAEWHEIATIQQTSSENCSFSAGYGCQFTEADFGSCFPHCGK